MLPPGAVKRITFYKDVQKKSGLRRPPGALPAPRAQAGPASRYFWFRQLPAEAKFMPKEIFVCEKKYTVLPPPLRSIQICNKK